LQQRYHAAEATPSGFVFDSEQGSLQGGQIEAGIATDPILTHFVYRTSAGNLAYQGHNQIGLPLRTRTDLRLSELRLGLGPSRTWPVGGGGLGGELGAAEQQIKRDILPSPMSGPLTETMRTRSLFVGASWLRPLSRASRFSCITSLQYQRSRSRELRVDAHGAVDTLTLYPGAASAWLADLGLRYAPSPAWWLQINAGYTSMRFGTASPRIAMRAGMPAAIVSYPGSSQNIREIGLAATLVL